MCAAVKCPLAKTSIGGRYAWLMSGVLDSAQKLGMSVKASRRQNGIKRKRCGLTKRDQTVSEAQGPLPSMARGKFACTCLRVFLRADVIHRHVHVNCLADSLPQLRLS